MNGAGSVTGVATWKDIQNICRAILVRWRIVTRGLVENWVLQKPSSDLAQCSSQYPSHLSRFRTGEYPAIASI